MRILIASDFYAPFIGGAERQVQLLGRELTKHGHTVCIATVWQTSLVEKFDDAGVRVRRIRGLTTRIPGFFKDSNNRFHPPFPDPGIVWGLRRILKEFHPDVVHANGWIAYSCAAALIGSKTPLLVSVRDYGYSCAIRTLLYNGQTCSGPALVKCVGCAKRSYGLPKALAAVAAVFGAKPLLTSKMTVAHCISTYVQMTVQRDLAGKGRKHRLIKSSLIRDIVLPSMYEQSEISNSRKSFLAKLPNVPFILFVGALTPHKGLHNLLEAYTQLSSPPPLVLIGTVWSDTPKTFPSNVYVFSNMPHTSVMVAWQKCLFGVAPSLWPEPLGGVILEAMSQGKAIVSTNIGGPVDMVINGETGFLVSPGDSKALAQAMQTLLDDPLLRESFGKAALARIPLFTTDTLLPRFEDLYRGLTARGEGQRDE